ncbi:MAG: acetyl-CoA carboxylase carboxyltransferase subunit alpha [Oligoflexales bacterium]|nr:acetyl-CoA carboxylase carboxyltransferase subunit alpha [Oligoflexales bacterium]
MDYIPLEKPLADLEIRVEELRRMEQTQALDCSQEIKSIERKISELITKTFSSLSPYDTVQLSRHPRRPNTKELIELMGASFTELHGDRNFYDDQAIVGGLATLDGHSLVIIGHQKGRGTKENILRNFGMPKPEGYRKALRLMSLAERFQLPILTLIDTPGAYPGIGAEERGQSEAIGKNILVMCRLRVPIITIVIGEGGSGGALALGVANRIHMMEHAVYSVISPEGCASILLKDARKADEMASALKLTASSALRLNLIDSVIPEPLGGAHRDPEQMGKRLRILIGKELEELSHLSGEELSRTRVEKFMGMGLIEE